MSREPTVNVPVTMFLELVRHYELQSQNAVSRSIYLPMKTLERGAYRKQLEWKKKERNNEAGL